MKFYVYVSKLNNSSLALAEFITRINYKYKVENLYFNTEKILVTRLCSSQTLQTKLLVN